MSTPSHSVGEDFWKSLFKEDAPEGDITADSFKIPKYQKSAKIYAKEDISLSGADLILSSIPKNLEVNVTVFFKDGQRLVKGQCLALFEGPWKSLLLIERPILNWLGHFSGIASLSWKFSNEVKNTNCKILDTRKTTPLYRSFEKKAVKDGGAFNHRFSLSDAMMLKENHLSLVDFNFKKAVDFCLEKNPSKHLTVETQNISDVEMVLKTPAHRIMLDNFSNDEIKRAVKLINGEKEVEASGNMTLDRVKSVAECGVDFISVGALTHSAPQADLTMLMDF